MTKFEAYVIMIMMFSIDSCYRLFCVLFFFSLSEACYRPYFCLCGLLTDSIVIAVYYTIDICMRFTLFGRSVTCVVRMTRSNQTDRRSDASYRGLRVIGVDKHFKNYFILSLIDLH